MNSLTKTNNNRTFKTLLLILIITGVILSLFQFLYNPGLWYDESRLALNVVARSFKGLLEPLDFNQSAPIGFLLVEKAFAILFGNTDYSLRIFPLLCFLITIPLFYLTTKKLTGREGVALISTALMSLNFTMVYFSCEAKQYATDVCITVVIIITTLNFRYDSFRSIVFYSLIGVIAIWLSNIAIVILFIAGLDIVFRGMKKKVQIWKLIIPIAIWVLTFIIYYFLFIHLNPMVDYMITYWQDYFLSDDFLSGTFYISLLKAFIEITSPLLLYNNWYWILPGTLIMFGIIILFRNKSWRILYYTLAPIILHLLISLLQLYPIQKRFTLYILPLVIVIISVAIHFIYGKIHRFAPKGSFIFILIIAFTMIFPFRKFPIQKEGVKESMSYIENRIDKTNKIYIYYAFEPAFRFYEKHYPKLSGANKFYGIKSRDDWSKYEEDVKRLNGTVWLLFTFVWPFDPLYNEKLTIVEMLKNYGFVILDEMEINGSSAIKISNQHLEN